MPTPTKVESERPTRYIAERSGPLIVRDGKQVVDATDVLSVGGPDGHTHQVEEATEDGRLVRFITCRACAEALGWLPEGSTEADRPSAVNLSRAMNQ